jgi:pimeloyl-ACP methyl ester carboxylesterase
MRPINLDVHISEATSAVIWAQDPGGAVLVGHGYGGSVITGVADRLPYYVRALVYVDAFVPDDGESVLDLVAPDRRQILEDLVKNEGGGWLLPRFAPPPWETIVRDMWGVKDDADVQWMLERLTPTPIGHFRDPVTRTNPAANELPRTYIRCPRYPNPRFDRHAEMARNTRPWRYRELETSHHPAVVAPDRLTELLLELAS